MLYNFTGGNDGGVVAGGVVLDATGNLYGMTNSGGTDMWCEYGCGVIFELTPQANGQWSESVLFDFTKDSGGASRENLLFDGAGNLFGGTESLGPGQPGHVFELTPGSGGWNFNPIYNGGGGCLVFDQAENLFGCIGAGEYFGAGALGELSPGPDGWTYNQLYSFCSLPRCADGYYALYPLSWDAKGNLYGTTYQGGYGQPRCPDALGCGVAFELTRVSPSAAAPGGVWAYHIMHRFGATANDGQNPLGGLTLDRFGNAYGTTPVGGAGCPSPGCGTVFKLTRVPAVRWLWAETILYDFPDNCSQGCAPAFDLVFDKAGNLYGINGGGLVCAGGAAFCGMIYKLSPQPNGQWSYSIVHEFNGQDGEFPNGLTIDGNGNLFGTTMSGGTYNYGVVFQIQIAQ